MRPSRVRPSGERGRARRGRARSFAARQFVAIARHYPFEMDMVSERTLVYGMLTAGLGAIHLTSVVLLRRVLRPFTRDSELAIASSTLVLAALFHPARSRFQAAVDRRFYRAKYDAARTLEVFGQRLRTEVDLDHLSAELRAVVQKTVQPAHVSLWLSAKYVPVAESAKKRPEGGGAAVVDVDPGDPLMAHLASLTGAVDVDALRIESPGAQALRAADVRLVVPLVSRGELIGMLALGPRLSKRPYSRDDRELLDNLAARAAPAVRVAQLVRIQEAQARERERMDNEMRVARLIQQNLLPKQMPSLPGWRVGAHYQPARAVGGDFYDFIELADGQLAMMVGDVTDKGVPAALLMAAARSVLRGSTQRLGSPGEALARVNELLYPDTPPHMFVTCLIAVLDPSTGRLRYANAGHDVPYVRRADGSVAELRARGMPLGLMPGMVYQEQETVLAPGEHALFYSDGLAEAHNPAGEMLGFPRIKALVGGHSGGEGFIERLLDELARFAGPDWEQEDDVMLVTLLREATSPGREVSAVTAPASSVGAARPAEGNGSGDTQQDFPVVPDPPRVENGGVSMVLADFTLPSEPGNERLAMQRVAEVVAALGMAPKRLERLKTAVAEATMNAIEHGNHNRPELPVDVRVIRSGDRLTVQIADRGEKRPIPEVGTPDLEAKLAGLDTPRGWGLFLIRNMVDEMRASGDEHHHVLELTFYLEGVQDAAE